MTLYPQNEETPDLNRGEIRLATEVLLATILGTSVPQTAIERAATIADIMANG